MGFLRKTLSVTVCLLILFTIPVKAANTAENYSAEIDGILDFICNKTECENLQSFVDTVAAENAAGAYDWYVYSLFQNGNELDYSEYLKRLSENAENSSFGAVEKERFALILSAFGKSEEYVSSVTDNCTGKLGIMSYIYALHILNNKSSSETEEVKQQILSMQQNDGSWSLNGKETAVDVTAMAISSLAPFYGNDKETSSAVDNALNVLSSAQTENGGFISYGVENSESTVQVIIALCSLGISPENDTRFIKNGKNPIDALLSYKLADGSFEHKKGGGYNFKATEQALSAFISLENLKDGKTPYYIFAGKEISAKSSFSSDTKTILLCITVFLLAVSLIIAFILTKRKNRASNIFFVLSALLLISVFIFCSDFKSADTYYSVTDITSGENTVTVSMSVTCDTVKEHSAEKNYIPADGIILPQTEITLNAGSTVYDCLVYAAKKYSIHIENDSQTGSDNSTAYISGINYLYEFDYGELSGWMFFVNGEKADTGCGEYELKNNDVVEWKYTLTLGEDL